MDISIDAFIPDHYIENLSQRIDCYRKIASIGNEEDSRDVIDELIDRYGDPPKSVLGLVNVALTRNTASKLGIKERPKDTPTRQACAAVGQCELMYLYDNLFSEYSLNVAQLLLTKYILLEDRRINVQNALNRIIELGSIPIVNENDTVSIDELELEMGENDSLAANVAVLANADLLIIMSDIEGLFDKDPHKYDDAELIPVVPEITEEIKAIAGGAGSSLGTGGMATKIKAAEICKNGGIDLIIMNGRDPRHLYKVFENKPIGTLFTANGEV